MSDQQEKPLWLRIEDEIQNISDADLAGEKMEGTVHAVAAKLDAAGENVAKTGGKLLQVRWALEARSKAGHAMKADLDSAIGGLTLDDVGNPDAATMKIVRSLTGTWPVLKEAEYISDLKAIVTDTRLELLTTEAKSRSLKEGVRYLHEEDVAPALILTGLGIDQAKLDEVDAELAAEAAELKRVGGLFAAVADQDMEERLKHLLSNDAKDDVIIQVAGVDQAAVDSAKDTMRREIEEKERLAAEEAARKAAEKAAAEAGPALDDIPDDEMLEFIESIREIMEFSDVEDEIRTMCEQSSIPKSLVDIAVSEPDKLDELEAKAEG